MPLISVIIPCFKQAHFLQSAIASLQRQGVEDWEAIIVDDGSPDDTAAVALALAQQDARVRLVRKSNGGLSSARNAGMAAASGDWLQFLDADDELTPNRFIQHTQLLEEQPLLDLTVSDWQVITPDGQRSSTPLSRPRLHSPQPWLELALRWEHDLSIPVHCVLVRNALIKAHACLFNEQLPNHEDWCFWMDVWANNPRVVFTGQIGALYRMHSAAMTRNDSRMYQGYLQALQLQERQHANNRAMAEALGCKRYIGKVAYGYGLAGGLREFLATGPLKRVLPWPWQKWLLALRWLNPAAMARREVKRLGGSTGSSL